MKKAFNRILTKYAGSGKNLRNDHKTLIKLWLWWKGNPYKVRRARILEKKAQKTLERRMKSMIEYRSKLFENIRKDRWH